MSGTSSLELTKLLRTLHAVPDAKRDDEWYEKFFDTLPQAQFALTSDLPVKAPDGFYYLNVSLLPEDGKGKFDTISLDEDTLEDCLTRCVGIVIYPDLACKKDPVWILSYGELHSYYLYDSFAGDPQDLEEMVDAEEGNLPESDEDISVSAPDDEFIHPGARKFLKNFFDALGLEGVEIAMLTDPEQVPSRALVLSLTEHDFKSHTQIEDCMNTVSWLVPPTRLLMLDPGIDGDAFIPLK